MHNVAFICRTRNLRNIDDIYSDPISRCVPLVAECKTKGCDHLCISTAGGHGQCMCSQDYELQADNKTCKSKHNYHLSRNVVANIGTITICFQKHYAN